MTNACGIRFAFALLLTLLSVALSAAPYPTNFETFKDTRQNDTKIVENDSSYLLPRTLKPESYDIKLAVDPDGKSFSGSVKIIVNVLEEAKEIKLHAGSNLRVTSPPFVLLGKSRINIASYYSNDTTEIRTYVLESALKKGSDKLTVNLQFSGSLRDNMIGFYRSTYIDEQGEEKWVAATQFEATYARQAFPCFDEPAFKAKFTVSISHQNLPEGYHCLSNMPKSSKSTADLTVFEESVEMSTYLVAFVISDFKSNPKHPVSVWARSELVKQVDYATDIASQSLKVFYEILGEKYSLEKMDLVAVPDFSAGAMENWGLLTFREANLLFDEAHSTNSAKQRLASVVVHECAHMWFGNLVTPKWWSYLWLSEAFARYYQYMATAQCETKWQMEEQFVVEQHQTAMAVDALEDSKPMTRKSLSQSEIGGMGDSITYNKGASILRMIEQTFGSDVFNKALRSYLKNNKYSNTEPKDLWDALQQSVDTMEEKDQVDVAAYMKSWTEEPGFPYVKVDVKPDFVTFSQKRFLLRNSSGSDYKTVWSIPITYLSSATKSPSTRPEFWLTEKEKKVVNKNKDVDWLVFNVNSAGFYRVLYDNESWKKIIDVLKSDFTKIPVLNRAAIVDDLLNLARAELVGYDTALSALRYLKNENDYLPLKSALTSLDYLTKKFSATSDYELFKKFVTSLFWNTYLKLADDDKIEDNHLNVLLYQEISNKACYLDQDVCIDRSKKYFSEWRIKKIPVPKNLRSSVYCAAIKNGTYEDWNFLYEQYKLSKVATEQLTILSALGCSKNATIIENYLLTALSPNYQDSLIRKQDISSVINGVYSSLEGAELMLNFVETHYEAIKNYYKSYDEVGNIISGVLKNYPIRKFTARVERAIKNNPSHLKTVIPSLQKSLKLAYSEIKWFNKHSTTIIDWIKKNTEENTLSYRLPITAYPMTYALRLTPIFEPDFIFRGKVEIEAHVPKETNKIVLHADQLKIAETDVSVLSSDEASINYGVTNLDYDPTYHFLTINLDKTIEVGKYIKITIKYTGVLNTEMRGFYRSSYNHLGKKRWLAATHLEPVGARRVFPCFDEPGFKSTFKITVDAPNNYNVISNMPLRTTETGKEGSVWDFNSSPPMSTYLVAIVVSEFSPSYLDPVQKKYAVWSNPSLARQTQYSLSCMKPIVDDFVERLKVPYENLKYNILKLDMVALPDFSSGAMENWGLLTFRETNLLYDPEEMSSVVDRQAIRNVISHEITHQWFGDLVSPHWWDYLWLNEGFARYFQYFQYTKTESSWNLEVQFVVDHLHTSFVTDASSSTHPITHEVYTPAQIKGMFDTISYAKAASVIRMIEKIMGTDKFYNALTNYLKTNEFSTAQPADLFKAFQKEFVAYDITAMMKNWTTQAGFPVVNVKVNGNKVELSQKRFYTKPKSDPEKYAPFTYIVPITYTTGANPNFEDTHHIDWLKEKSMELTIPNADKNWLIFNVQQMGYYRVNYDEESWRRIFAVLDSDDYTKIHEINRAMIIDDLFNLARANQLSYDLVLAGTRYLRRETAYTPWKAAKTGFSYLEQRFAGHPTIFKSYRTHIFELVKPIVEKLKFSDKKDDVHTDKLLRKLIADWMCSLDNEECTEQARALFDKQRRYPKDDKIPPNQKHFAYCTSIRHGMQNDWDYLKKKFEETDFATEKITILTALGCSQNSSNLKSLLNDVIKKDSSIRLQDAQKVFSYVINGGSTGVMATLEFIKESHDQMKEYFGDDSVTKSVITTISKRLSTEAQLEEFKKFIDYGHEKIPTISKFLQTSLNNAMYEINWYKEKYLRILKSLDKIIDINYRLPKIVNPLNYDIYLTPYFKERNFTFDGKAVIKINFVETSSKIVIHTHKLDLKTVTLNNAPIKLSNIEYHEVTQQSFIYLEKDNEIPAGTDATLVFEYSGILRHDMKGFYKSSYIDIEKKTKWMASTQFEPTYARSAFPCFDEPSFKATFNINIARQNNYHTLSNMGSHPTQTKHESIKDRTWDKYPETPIMSSYLVAFVVSEFVREKAANSNVAVWSRKELQHYCNYASTAGQDALTFLGDKLAQRYTLKEMNFVSVPDFDMGAMENWGLVTFREYGLSYDEHQISATYRRYVNTVVSHELVHMWFGDLVTLEWWDYTWLNEGFAEYLSYIVSHDSENSWELLKQFVVNELQVAFDADAVESSHAMNNHVLKPTDIQNAFDKIAYQKAGSVLRMFHNSFGEENFFKILQRYIQNNMYKNTRPEHLIGEFENHYKTTKVAGNPPVTVSEIMNSWVNQSGYPVVNVHRSKDYLIFTQERFLASGDIPAKKQNYWIPITYTTETEKDFDKLEPKFWLDDVGRSVSIKHEDSWYIVNVQEVGYYRVNYQPENWEKLIKILNSDQYTIIPDLNRAQIIDDSLNLARADRISYEIALNATKYLSQETNYFSWKAFFNAVAYLSQRIEGQPEIKSLFTKHILALVSKAYDSLGFKENTGEDAHLDQLTRELILTYACKYGHKDCIEQSKDYFKRDSVTPNIAIATYCTAIEHGTKDDWNKLWGKFENSLLASDYITILKGLGCSTEASVLNDYLDLALVKDSKIRRQDFATVVSSIYTSSQIGLETALKYFKNNAETLRNYYGDWEEVGALFTGLAGRISKKEQIEELKNLVNDGKLSNIKSSLESAVKTAQKNLEWFEKHLDVIRTWFEGEYGSSSSVTPTPSTATPPTSSLPSETPTPSTNTPSSASSETTTVTGPTMGPIPPPVEGDGDGAATISVQISLLLITLLSYVILS